jgi:hypothetical protein
MSEQLQTPGVYRVVNYVSPYANVSDLEWADHHARRKLALDFLSRLPLNEIHTIKMTKSVESHSLAWAINAGLGMPEGKKMVTYELELGRVRQMEIVLPPDPRRLQMAVLIPTAAHELGRRIGLKFRVWRQRLAEIGLDWTTR